MTNLDLRQAFNALSDVVVNRPPAIREFDQIYMKISDMLLHAEFLSRWMDGKSLVFLGDGDAIGLTLSHLKQRGIFERGPNRVLVLDFDERVVNSVNGFAKRHHMEGNISAMRYNVADPLPDDHFAKFDAFHINPPFGESNDGRSVEAFLRRGNEALSSDGGTGCIVIADNPALRWTRTVMSRVQNYLFSNGFLISELIPKFHHYHLDDDPELTSCSLIAVRHGNGGVRSISKPLTLEEKENFYGSDKPLDTHYIIDLRNGGLLPSKDYQRKPFE